MSILEQEVRDPFIDQNQNEFELKSCSPFHELKKDDYLLEFIFCLRCGDEKRPKILEKFILKREKDIEDQLVDEYYKDGEETKHRRVKKAKFKGILICYCEILNCDCGELRDLPEGSPFGAHYRPRTKAARRVDDRRAPAHWPGRGQRRWRS